MNRVIAQFWHQARSGGYPSLMTVDQLIEAAEALRHKVGGNATMVVEPS